MPKVRQAISKSCLCWVLVLFGLTVAEPTWAQSESKRLIVTVPESSTGLVADELVAALRGQLQELGVEVVLSRAPVDVTVPTTPADGSTEQDALAFVWLGTEGDVLAVHFFESAGATLRQRRLPLRGTDAASLEEVALVVRSAVSALLERKEPEREEAVVVDAAPTEGAPPEASEEPSEREPRTPASAGRAPLWVEIGWVGQSYAPQLPFSHGAQLALGVRPNRGAWGVGFGYSLLPTQTAKGDAASVTIARHPLEAFFSLQSFAPSSVLFAGFEAGVLADFLQRRTSLVSPEFLASPSTTRVSWAFSARALLGIRLGSKIAFQFHAGGDLVAQRVKSSFEDGTELVTPHRLRPRLQGLISWDLP